MTKEKFLAYISGLDEFPEEWQSEIYEYMRKVCDGRSAMLELKRRAKVIEEKKWNDPYLESRYYLAKIQENKTKEEEIKRDKSVLHKLINYFYTKTHK